MESAQLRQLRERESALRAELMVSWRVANDIYTTGRWSMLGGTDGANQVPRSLGQEERNMEVVLQNFPKLDVGPIGEFNHWDRRECRVQNPEEWKRCRWDRSAVRDPWDPLGPRKLLEDPTTLVVMPRIPKVIHQIWVGPKEPPCLWLDTFRSDYLEAHPDWSYEIWSDERVAKLPMFNEKIYVEEKMWQCKADILRLEFLWHHGGVYVDADMISVGKKSLNPIVELGKDTGFVIAYEPDTKDKPYSILGNSVIACTPHHPLILMLILYLKQTFYQKRNHIEVFAVTGPVMYTKCLVDSGMPISIAAQELLYPAFHFVPNPDAIDFSRFPKCLMFQFGYTCSGLEGYVKRRNRCKRPAECPFHTKTPYLQSYKSLVGPETPLYGQVPVALSYLETLLALPVPADGSFALEEGTAMFLVDGEMVQLVELRHQVAGFMNRVRHHPWDVLMLGMEWSTGADEVRQYAKRIRVLHFFDIQMVSELCIHGENNFVTYQVCQAIDLMQLDILGYMSMGVIHQLSGGVNSWSRLLTWLNFAIQLNGLPKKIEQSNLRCPISAK
ncbi:unnamed protein product [Cladocopium goreaui]|uniref:Uncharacterized glycosyltransferase L373 n=1 Tax=Cladocopium goreaui TaxID=2562237 RepID=A0A9P1BSR4_9DINO|nr:unnamed protein product [Cladocopium goreaui]